MSAKLAGCNNKCCNWIAFVLLGSHARHACFTNVCANYISADPTKDRVDVWPFFWLVILVSSVLGLTALCPIVILITAKELHLVGHKKALYDFLHPVGINNFVTNLHKQSSLRQVWKAIGSALTCSNHFSRSPQMTKASKQKQI